jgi:hypothetical protein
MKGRWRALLSAVGASLPLLVTACGNSGPPDFTLALAAGQPAALAVAQGSSTMVGFQVGAVKNSNGSIILTLSGLPAGVGVAPGSATVGIGSTQQFQLTAAGNAAVTAAPVTLTATGVSGSAFESNSITHSQTVTLSVVAHP